MQLEASGFLYKQVPIAWIPVDASDFSIMFHVLLPSAVCCDAPQKFTPSRRQNVKTEPPSMIAVVPDAMQVRHMVGAMLTAGRGRLALADIRAKLELGNARPPGVTLLLPK